jgi:hypothetical protein
MNDHTTAAVRRLPARAVTRVAWWQRQLTGRLQAGDTFARRAGWTITHTKFGGQIYRDPRFRQLSATRTPRPPHKPAPPPAPGARPAPVTSPPPPVPADGMEPQGRNR